MCVCRPGRRTNGCKLLKCMWLETVSDCPRGLRSLCPRPSHFCSLRINIVFMHFGLMRLDRSRLSNRRNLLQSMLSSKIKVNLILNLQKILSQGVQIDEEKHFFLRKKLNTNTDHGDWMEVASKVWCKVMPFIVFPDCYFKFLSPKRWQRHGR